MTQAERNERRRRQLDRVRITAILNGQSPDWTTQASHLEREAQKHLRNERIKVDRLVEQMIEKGE